MAQAQWLLMVYVVLETESNRLVKLLKEQYAKKMKNAKERLKMQLIQIIAVWGHAQ